MRLSRVGRAELQRKRLDLSALAREVAAELQRECPDRPVQVLIAEGLEAEGDPRLLQVVLENLLGNAFKFTKGAAQAIVEFGVMERDGIPTYFVRDNGVGFDMAYVDMLFTPFQRLHAQTKFSGTGIGLATVHRIIDRHGGRIWAEGAVDHGATFFWTLPGLRLWSLE